MKRRASDPPCPPGFEPPTARIRPFTSPRASAGSCSNAVPSPPCASRPLVCDPRETKTVPQKIPSPVFDPKQKNALLECNTEVIVKTPSESKSQAGGKVLQNQSEKQSGQQVQLNCESMPEYWLLKKGLVPGGPSIPDLIPSFGGHVALDVWVGKERGTLLGHNYMRYLIPWLDKSLPDVRAREMVKKSGLLHLRHSMFPSNNMPLLSAFVERWQPDTNTFHMPFGEITITLHDVWQILRLPIQGKAITALEGKAIGGSPPPQELRDAVAKLLGFEDQFELLQLSSYNERGLPLDSIKNLCGQVNRTSEQQAAGYLLYLVGASLFVGKSGKYFRPNVYWLLRNVNEVSDYAWGAGTLAWLYRQLGIASRAGSLELSGCLTLLECWIYEYFPFLRPSEFDGYQPSDPRVFKWKRKPAQKLHIDLLHEYRAQLDKLTGKDVNWQPYGVKPWEVQQNRTLFHGTINYFNIVEPYMPVRVLRQFGFLQEIPAPPISPLKMERPRGGIPYVANYPSIPEIWNTPWSGTINPAYYGTFCTSPGSSPNESTVAEYMSWYIPRTHLRISKPISSILNDVGRLPRSDSVYERFVDIIGPWLPSYRGFHYLDQSKEELEYMYARFDEAFRLMQSVMTNNGLREAQIRGLGRTNPYTGWK